MRAVTAATSVLVLLFLLGLVAIASSDGRRDGTAPVWTPPVSVFDYGFTLVVLLLVGLLLVAANVRWSAPRRATPRLRALQLLAFTAVLAAIAAIAYRVDLELHPPAGTDAVAERIRGRAEEAERARPRAGRPRDVQFKWELAAAAALAAAAVFAAHRMRRRADLPPRPPASLEEELLVAVDDSIDDLRAERDERRAVIAAYARLERAFAAHGLPRRPHEAPLEYLSRVLRAVRVRADAAVALTELFERAKFSPHEIDAAMKDEAITALVAVREDLAEAA